MSQFYVTPPSPYKENWQTVQPIKNERKNKEEGAASAETYHFLSFLLFFQNLISDFLPRSTSHFFDKETITQELQNLKRAFYHLQQSDLSHDPLYTADLHLLWHNLNYSFNQIMTANYTLQTEIMLFLNELNTFPPWEAHSLGFYLNNHAGSEWLPIPFMDILYTLHHESHTNPIHNQINRWIHQIDLIEDRIASLL